MNELRKDYILDRWVIIAAIRGKRPSDFIKEEKEGKLMEKDKSCPFCPGNENLTPPEIYRVEEKGNWIIRCVPNKYPATTKENFSRKRKKFHASMTAYGNHEVIIETPLHNKELSELDAENIKKVLDVYTYRLEENLRDPNITYVSIFKNYGRSSGASLIHTHSQLISLPLVPRIIKEKMKRSHELYENDEKCSYCDIVEIEKESPRFVAENKNFVAFCPFAARFPFETWIFPKKHITSLTELNDRMKLELARILKDIINKLRTKLGKPSYNFYFHLSPKNGNLHMHLIIFPRLSEWAGFEFSNEIVINPMPPELAAAYLRGEEK